MPRYVALAFSIWLLAGCGGGSSALPKTASAPTPAKAHVNVTISMHVPGAATARTAALKRIFTAAQNTQGVQVSVYSAGNDTGTPLATTAADIAAGASGCTTDASGNRTCTFAISAPAGSDDFILTTYDQVPVAGAIPSGANELGWGSDLDVTIATGAANTVNATLSSVLASVSLTLAPSSLHQLIPSTGTVGVIALDADSDVIVSNGFVDANGNNVTISLGLNNSLSGALTLSTGSISAPSATGVQYVYAPPSGVLQTSASAAITVSASPSSTATGANATLNAIFPTFTNVADANLNVFNVYHGGIAFDNAGGVYFSTQGQTYGTVDYYPGTGSSTSAIYTGSALNPIRGGIAGDGTNLYAIAGSALFRGPLTGASTSLTNVATMPPPNGSALAVVTGGQLAYVSSTTIAVVSNASGSPSYSNYATGVTPAAGITGDANGNIWMVDNVDSNNELYELPFDSGSVSAPTTMGYDEVFDVFANSNGLWLTNPTADAIVQASTSGSYENTYTVPQGGQPYYLMQDNAQPGIVWFSYTLNGEPGIGRMDTNVSPPTFVMATDANAAYSASVGAIGAASNGLVYIVEDGGSTLIQVSR